MSLLMAGALNQMIFKVPSNPNHSMILFYDSVKSLRKGTYWLVRHFLQDKVQIGINKLYCIASIYLCCQPLNLRITSGEIAHVCSDLGKKNPYQTR